jgi:hypothetical protein
MRMRYIININTKSAFARVHYKINQTLAKPFVPGILRNMYTKFSGFLAGMAEMEVNQAANGGQNAGGGRGLLGKCEIF